jgi:hypothetical protein
VPNHQYLPSCAMPSKHFWGSSSSCTALTHPYSSQRSKDIFPCWWHNHIWVDSGSMDVLLEEALA